MEENVSGCFFSEHSVCTQATPHGWHTLCSNSIMGHRV